MTNTKANPVSCWSKEQVITYKDHTTKTIEICDTRERHQCRCISVYQSKSPLRYSTEKYAKFLLRTHLLRHFTKRDPSDASRCLPCRNAIVDATNRYARENKPKLRVFHTWFCKGRPATQEGAHRTINYFLCSICDKSSEMEYIFEIVHRWRQSFKGSLPVTNDFKVSIGQLIVPRHIDAATIYPRLSC